MPMTWIVLTLLLSFFLKKWAKKLRITSIALLFIFGNSFLLHEVSLLWESPITLDVDLKEYETAVVLGGYTYYSIPNERLTFRESSDRLFQAVRLLEQGKVKRLIISGGSGYVLDPELKEAEFIQTFLKELNIPHEQVLIEAESRNTHENALNTNALLQSEGLDKQTILLVTSAFHMRRSKACFENQGMDVVVFATDPTIGTRIFTIDHLVIPSANSLAYWNVLIHEWVGYLSYWVAGYV